MMDAEIKLMLEKLYEYEQRMNEVDGTEQYAVDQVLTPEIKQALDDIKVEFSEKRVSVQNNIEYLKQEIKTIVLHQGHSVEDDHYQVQWKKGRSGGFDTKMLDGMSRLIPQINDARKPDGEPTVVIISK